MHRIIAFVLAEGQVKNGLEEAAVSTPESGPPYVPGAIPRQIIIGKAGDVTLKAYQPNVLIAEYMREVPDAFSEESFRLRLMMIAECRRMLGTHGATLHISEEYAVAIIDGYEGSPDAFLAQDRAIVRFLKSEPLPLHKNEIDHAIQHRITYGENDLIIVDWDGACVFQQNGQTDAIVDLLQLANLHLLQYRMLDAELDRRLARMEKLIRTKHVSRVVFWNRELARAYKEMIRMRTTSIVEFDAIVREIKLIGDWYSARLYEAAARKFKLDGWRHSIREKLATLEDAYDIVAQNFRISKEYFFELMLQLGWLTLIMLELYQILR